MKKRTKRKLITSLVCGTLAIGTAVGAFWLLDDGEPASVTVSAGLQQLADSAYLAASATGDSISFTPEWFDNALLGESISAITVTALPAVTEGVLELGHTPVTVGQRISRENLSYLVFYPTNGVKNSSFSFVPATLSGDCGYALSCSLSLGDSANCCPVGKGPVTAASTHSTLALTGTLSAEDADGDALYFEIVSYPASGTVSLDTQTGRFSYLPAEGFSGEDRFTWRAQDARGGYSEVATLQITVQPLPSQPMFTDIADSNTQSAALQVAHKELMGGEAVGGKHYFHPDRTLTRGAFVAILLKAADLQFPEADSTGYEDDADIPQGLKGAIRYAKEQNWLGDGSRFRPNDPITRAEAAKIAAAVLGLSAPGYHDTVKDFALIPVQVADAMYALYEGGYISTMADGTLAPMGELTRGDAAKFFAQILDEKDT
ncbi:MAG: S-layer homology domain-containing protein [Clostridia bacterium]|nr:S-layer homology domain-containing protein [Clostridia bacterium]